MQYSNQNWTTGIQGISSNYPPLTNWHIDTGREITPDDEASAALVVVIGQTVATQLFGESQLPVGAPSRSRKLRRKDLCCTVSIRTILSGQRRYLCPAMSVTMAESISGFRQKQKP
ncbi:ABC transporter permease [Mesorhizobium caraganae]|uniref:ABC transporter permease n=1 Tax=Mesorhizobium caraganae TaxID=483206 RepID=UPI0028ADE201|nr:ABC transporter permease [Mesorhizobium caraganae]